MPKSVSLRAPSRVSVTARWFVATLVALLLGATSVAAPASAAVSASASLSPQPPDSTAAPTAGNAASPPSSKTEEVSARTEFSKTFDNPDGTKSVVISIEPMHYRDSSGSWQAIDSRVVRDASSPGSFRSSANSWTAHFKPLPTGVVIDTPAGPVSFSPVGASAVTPVLLSDGTGVVYSNAWPGADLRYRVRSGAVKEEIVLKQRPTTDHFQFTTPNIQFQQTTAGGLSPKFTKLLGATVPASKSLGAIAPPEVEDARGTPLALAAPLLTTTTTSSGSTLQVAFDQAAVSALPDSAYPIVVDPTWGSANMTSYKSDGVTCACGVRVGNTLEPGGVNKFWRSVGNFDYSSIYGAHVYSAQIDLQNLTAGTANGYTINANWATAYSYAGAAPGNGTYASETNSDTTSSILTGTGSATLTQLYDYWVHNSIAGGAIGFSGLEQNGLYTFKQFSSYTLTLTYGSTVAPPPTGVTTTDLHNGNVTVAWTPPTDDGGSAITGYTTKLWPAGANPNTTAPQNSWFCSGSGCTSATWTGFPDNTSWFFGVSTHNGVGDSATAYSATFTVHRLPGQPGSVTSYAGNAQVLTTWTAAPTNGGPPIDRYDVYRYDPVSTVWTLAGSTCGTCTSFQSTGLTNGRAYTVAVYAHNQWGFGPYGSATAVTPAANVGPYPPQWVNASAGNTAAWIVWDNPKANGGAAVTGYTVQLFKAGVYQTTTGVLTPSSGMNTYKWTGLTNANSYTFRVVPWAGSTYGYWVDTNAVTPTASPPPYPPITASVTATDRGLMATWSAPDASSPLPTSYFVQILSEDGSYYSNQATVTPAAVFGGLTNGVKYRIFIMPSGANGTAAGYAFTPYLAPSSSLASLGVPTNVQATRGDTQATVTWTAPTISISGVTTYVVKAYSGSTLVATSPATTNTSAVVTGLKNGTPVNFTVTATTVLFTGNASAPSNTVTPAGRPFAPENPVATRGDHQLTLTWSPPSARADGTPGDNGDPITSYVVTLTNLDTSSVTHLSTSATTVAASGLTNGQRYVFTVRATNSIGDSGESVQSNPAIPAGRPLPPTAVTASAGNRSAVVSWAAADGNGDPVQSYSILATRDDGYVLEDDGVTVSPHTFAGLEADTGYTFTVIAINGVGASDPSTASTRVVPFGPPEAPGSLTAYPGDGLVTVCWASSVEHGTAVTGYELSITPADSATITVSASETCGRITGLSNGTTYTVAVRAMSDAGPSGYSTVQAVPSAPALPPGFILGTVFPRRAAGQSATAWAHFQSPGAAVVFTIVSGPDTGASGTCSHFFVTSTCAIDDTGWLFWTYQSAAAGTDTVQAFEDVNGNGVRDAGEPVGSEVMYIDRPARYVALGDSFSAGQGVPPYFTGSDTSNDQCHRSTKSYPSLFTWGAYDEALSALSADQASGVSWANVTCSGAKIADVAHNGTPSFEGPQLDNPEVQAGGDVVTITIGGNDMRFADVLSDCALHACMASDYNLFGSGKNTETWLHDTAESLRSGLRDLYLSIKQTVGPDATVVVLGYPNLFPATDPEQTCFKLHPWLHEMDQLRYWTGYFDDVIRDSAAQAGVYYLDVRQQFAGHEVCGSDGEYINGPSAGAFSDSWREDYFHPNTSGQRDGYQATLTAFIDGLVRSGVPVNGAGLPLNPTPSP